VLCCVGPCSRTFCCECVVDTSTLCISPRLQVGVTQQTAGGVCVCSGHLLRGFACCLCMVMRQVLLLLLLLLVRHADSLSCWALTLSVSLSSLPQVHSSPAPDAAPAAWLLLLPTPFACSSSSASSPASSSECWNSM
jgi:hypothetical protein